MICRKTWIVASLALMANPSLAEPISFFSAFPAINKRVWHISHGWANGDYQACEWREDAITVDRKTNNLILTLSDDKHGGELRPYSCPEIHTAKVTGYGLYEARLRTAKGSGLNTAFFTYVGPPVGVKEHDEIDFEFLGKNSRSVQLNYITNGDGKHSKDIDLGFDASKEFHTYAFNWQPEKITWYIDGKKVHETPDDAKLPYNPGRIYFSLWAGTKRMSDWLGLFQYNGQATAEVAWVKFTPAPTP